MDSCQAPSSSCVPSNGDGKETEPPTVYVDGFTGDLYLDKPNEIERYDGVFKEDSQRGTW
jgi:hypothetical protein